MATKQCAQCGKVKDVSQYSKCKARQDGLQVKCKACNKIQNDAYRNEKPEYWSYETGYFSDKKKWKYITEYQRADKSIKVYKIHLPNDEIYIGSTKRLMNVRMGSHIGDYHMFKKGLKQKYIPGLYDAFDKIGSLDDIKEWISKNTFVLEETIGERRRQHMREQWWMDKYKEQGKKLVNSKRAYTKQYREQRDKYGY